MQDLSLNAIFFGTIAVGIFAALWFFVRFKLLLYYQIAAKRSILKVKLTDTPFFYSSYALKQECFRKFLHLPLTKETKLALEAMKNPQKTKSKIKQALKQSPDNFKLQLLLAEVSRVSGDVEASRVITAKIKCPFFAPSVLKAHYWHLFALNALYETDMYVASRYATRAIRVYQKQGFSLEEASCYMTLAQIYRVSGVLDVAVTMLKEAEKIYAQYDIFRGVSEAKAYLGLGEMMRENYLPAEAYLREAATLCSAKGLSHTYADICNWRGLNAYLSKEDKSAQQFFTEALQKAGSVATAAFAAEMLSRLALKQEKYRLAQKYIDKALAFYRESHHDAGIFEMLYLKAEIAYIKGKLPESRQILTLLIKEKTAPTGIWYPANAYTLLGLVELKDNNFSVAKNLFKQAVDLEHGRNRIKGAVIDYNNLAELCRREGCLGEAEFYLKQALSYAENIGDVELQTYIKSKIQN